MTQKRRILLGEDDETNRLMLRVVLEKKGFDVFAVQNGLEVLEALDGVDPSIEEGPFDVILLDWMMPVLSGIEALRRLRLRLPDVPVIMLTALGAAEDVVSAFAAGADDYVTKPYDFNVLLARIEARLRHARDPGEPVAMNRQGDPGPGLVIDHRYELLEVIGSGSFGVVYRARHATLETDVAVKVLRGFGHSDGTERVSPIDSRGVVTGRLKSQESAEEFRNEGVRSCRVRHEHAVRVFDFGHLPSGLPYLVMELLKGRTLADELRERTRLSLRRAVEVLMPVCQCLAAAHGSKLVHRDIKPANIFLHEGPQGEIVKVVDFGVAKVLADDGEATRDTIAGSPAYMAPERLRGRKYDGRIDVYALGITLYELLTGSVPFRSANSDAMAVAMMQLREVAMPPTSLVPSLPSVVDSTIAVLLAKDPNQRPDARAALAHLQRLLDAARD
jgi:DNA-binding response OmpR family regulator